MNVSLSRVSAASTDASSEAQQEVCPAAVEDPEEEAPADGGSIVLQGGVTAGSGQSPELSASHTIVAQMSTEGASLKENPAACEIKIDADADGYAPSLQSQHVCVLTFPAHLKV